jgi:hypothetical protein
MSRRRTIFGGRADFSLLLPPLLDALEGQRPLLASDRTLAEALRAQHEGSKLFPLQP